jgi:hypothetical protein
MAKKSKCQVKDSGTRRKFVTGAVRDCAVGKGRMDLLPFRTLIRLAQHFEDGATKYGDDNWRAGIDLRCYVDSAVRHLSKFMIGMRDEPHLIAAIWNLVALYETEAMITEGLLPESLNNLPNNPIEITKNPHNIQPTNKRETDGHKS